MKIQFTGSATEVAKQIICNELSSLQLKDDDFELSISFDFESTTNLPDSVYRVLVLLEPSVVIPWQYRKEVRDRFDFVIPMSPWRAKRLGYSQYSFVPYVQNSEWVSPWTARSMKLVMLNAHKFSAGQRSNYGLRRAVSKSLSRRKVDYELYGWGWNMKKTIEARKRLIALRYSLKAREAISIKEVTSEFFWNFPEYQVHVQEKHTFLSDSEACLVIENESDYISEKLFDVIVAGSVPIYVGPDFSKTFPELFSCVIPCKASKSELIDTVQNMNTAILDEKRHNIQMYQSFTGYGSLRTFSVETVWGEVSAMIRKDLVSKFG